MPKPLTRDITSYDLLKSAAVIIMIIDHVGFYFFPTDLWWRVIGRVGFPVWFFLVGHAKSREYSKELWIGGAIVAASRIVSGFIVFPLNALFTILACRYLIDKTMSRALRNYQTLFGMLLLLFFLSFPSMIFIEYGTLALMFAMLGYLVRYRREVNIKPAALYGFAIAAGLAFTFNQFIEIMAFTTRQGLCLLLAVQVMCLILVEFRPASYPRLTKYAGPLAPLLRFMGRWTLEIYVVHLVILAGLAMWLEPQIFKPFNFHWGAPGALDLFMPSQGPAGR